MVRLLKANTHIVILLDDIATLVARVETDPEPVCAHIVDAPNLKLFQAGEGYEFFGEDEASDEHDIEYELDPEKKWHLILVNENEDPTAVAIDIMDEDEAEEKEEEEEDDEDDDEEDDEEGTPVAAKDELAAHASRQVRLWARAHDAFRKADVHREGRAVRERNRESAPRRERRNRRGPGVGAAIPGGRRIRCTGRGGRRGSGDLRVAGVEEGLALTYRASVSTPAR